MIAKSAHRKSARLEKIETSAALHACSMACHIVAITWLGGIDQASSARQLDHVRFRQCFRHDRWRVLDPCEMLSLRICIGRNQTHDDNPARHCNDDARN